jgi:predicted MFS family arabinose efflux permease
VGLAGVAVAVAAGLSLADASIVTLGLPSILIELDASVEGVALVLGVYAAVLAVALPFAAHLARRIGGARLGAVGLAVFCAASLACGLADSLAPLLALRGVQALGGAAALVASFELLDGGTPGPGRRLWVAASVFGVAVGPALGGALTEAFDWRAIFLAQAPIAAPGLVVMVRAARASHDRAHAMAREAPSESVPEPLPPRPAVALGLLSAALTAVIFLVVLMLVSGWSIEPLAAALAVSVLPAAALIASRLPGDPDAHAVAGCLLVAGGICCLALLPTASAWWTVIPQVLAGAGMGLALPALSGQLIPERTRRQAARLLSIRHAGIALALAALAPIISANLNSSIDTAREQGTAAVLDAPMSPEAKIEVAPRLFGGLDTDDPRGELQREVADAKPGLDAEQAAELSKLGDRLDEVVTGAVRSAFRVAFLVTAGLALAAALVLLSGAPAAALAVRRGAVAAAAVVSIAMAGAYGVAYASERDTVKIGDPCKPRKLPESGGITGILQDVSLKGLDRAACEFGSSREELLLALFDERSRNRFKREHGVDPRSITELGPALLGLGPIG